MSTVQDNYDQRNHTELNPFFLQKLFLSGVIDATVRIKLEGSNWKLFLGCFLEHKLSTK